MTSPDTLSQAEMAVVEAPAGCGKTHLIAAAVALGEGDLPQLILTHTHAGVDALRKHLATLGVVRSRFVVETIAGWSLRWAASFPETSGVQTDKPTGPEWDAVYGATVTLLQMGPYKRILRCSYAGVYVDEYQDCTVEQHKLILALAEVLPCRILGDPLQGIFDFGRNHPIDWERDVAGTFRFLPPLAKPWRWDGKNEQMGQWLLRIRQLLLEGRDIQMTSLPDGVRHILLDSQEQSRCCNELVRLNRSQTAVAIHQQPNQCHAVASRLKGNYSCIEPIDARDLFEGALRIGGASGYERAVETIAFATQCMTHVAARTRTTMQALAEGREPRPRGEEARSVGQAIRNIIDEDGFAPVGELLLLIANLPDVSVYRKELTREMYEALKEFASGEHETLHDAAWYIRRRTGLLGRRVHHRSVGSTLLVKGLEFDHAVVLDADGYNVKNLYVALTRGSRTLTVLSRQDVLHPEGARS